MSRFKFEKKRDDEDALQHQYSRRNEGSNSAVTTSPKVTMLQRFRQKPLVRQIHDVSFVPLVAGAIGVTLCAGLGGPTGLLIALGIVFVAALFVNLGSAMDDKELSTACAQGFSCGMAMK